MRSNLWMVVTMVCLWNKATSQTNFPNEDQIKHDGLLDNLIIKVDTIDKNNKINHNELAEYFAGGKEGSDENAALIIKMIDKNGDNEVSKDEFLNIAKKIVGSYINIFDINDDGALSKDEFMGHSIDVNGAIKDVDVLFDLGDVNKDGLYSVDDGQIAFSQDDEQVKNYSKTIEIIINVIDKNDDSNISKTEVKDFVKTAINIINSNRDGEITKKEFFQTLEQNHVSKKTVDFLRSQSEDKTIINALENIFHKIDAQNKNDGKLYAEEIVQLLNKPVAELQEIGEGLGQVVISLFQDYPINTTELEGGVESFLKNAKFRKSGNENINSAAICHVNVFLVIFSSSIYNAI